MGIQSMIIGYWKKSNQGNVPLFFITNWDVHWLGQGWPYKMEIKKETLSMVNNDEIPMDYHSIDYQSMNYSDWKEIQQRHVPLFFLITNWDVHKARASHKNENQKRSIQYGK